MTRAAATLALALASASRLRTPARRRGSSSHAVDHESTRPPRERDEPDDGQHRAPRPRPRTPRSSTTTTTTSRIDRRTRPRRPPARRRHDDDDDDADRRATTTTTTHDDPNRDRHRRSSDQPGRPARRALAAADGGARRHGFAAVSPATYGAADTLHVLVGPGGARGPASARSSSTSAFIGTDARSRAPGSPSSSHGDSEVTLGYASTRRASTPRRSAARAASRSTWASSRRSTRCRASPRAAERPARRGPVPPVAVSRSSRSRPWRRCGGRPVAPVAPVDAGRAGGARRTGRPGRAGRPARRRRGELQLTGTGVSASSAGHVAASVTPVTGSPREGWNASSAASVARRRRR